MTEKEVFQVTVESPLGKGSIDKFQHFMSKIADDAKSRWGIKITIERVSEETDLPTEFDE